MVKKFDALALFINNYITLLQLFDNEKFKTETEQKYCFWNNIFIQLSCKDPKAYQQILAFLEEKQQELESFLLENFADAKARQEYGTDADKYIFAKMQALGF